MQEICLTSRKFMGEHGRQAPSLTLRAWLFRSPCGVVQPLSYHTPHLSTCFQQLMNAIDTRVLSNV